MGQEHSNGRRGPEAQFYGDVFVKIDQDTYLSDDTLTGTVYVSLRQPYPGDKLCLKVKGKEYTKWIDKEQRQRPREDGTIEYYYVDVPREAEFVSVKHVVDIYDWRAGTTIPPGQFSFPISFKIPPGLASSFFLRSGTTVAEIQYYVEAFLAPEKDLYPKIKHKRSITIRQALKNQIQTKEVSINKEVSTCCCCSKGNVSMWTAFEKNAYTPGETARVVTEVDNSKCQLAITNVRFELVQYININAGGHHKSLHFGICGENLGRVEPGQSFLKEQRKEASVVLPPAIEGNAKSFKGDQVTEYSLSPQQAIAPTTNGNLVKSNFGLRVSCSMDGCVCDAMPTTELPVTIYSIIQKKVSDPTPPPGWNPQPMPAANISITINVNGAQININTGGQPQGQPQGNPFMANNQMPPQQNNFQQPQPQIQQQPQNNFQQPQPQIQQQPQNNFQQQPQNNFQQQPQNNFQQQQQQPQSNFQQQPQNNFQQQPQNNFQQQPQNNFQQQPQNNYNQQPQNNYNQQPQNFNQGPQQMNTQGYNNNYGNPNQYGQAQQGY